MADIYFWRQFFILFTGIIMSICAGFMLAFPSVLNPALMSQNNTDITTTGGHASWIAAINGVGGLLGALVHSAVMQILGRKASHISLNACLAIGWIMIPFAKSISVLYAARFIQGMSIGGIYVSVIIVSEYVHPNRRGYFLTLKKATIAIGTLSCHTLGAFWTWRQIASFAAVLPLVAIVLTLFWPESPSHLALKGKYSECEASFIWLNGNSEENQKQLKALVESQKTKAERYKKGDNALVDLLKKIASKDFQRVLLMSSILTLCVDLSGRYYVIAYIVQMMRELLGNETSVLYFSAAADLLTLAALLMSSIVIRHFKRRTILFSSGASAVVLMLSISVLVYLKTVFTFSKYALWFIALIIVFQCFVVNIGLIPVSFVLIGEIFPLENKGLGAFASCFVFTSLYALSLKITPILMEHTGLYGTYAVYGVALAVCLLSLLKTVPETKDRTLQDIEDELKGTPKAELIVMEQEKLMN